MTNSMIKYQTTFEATENLPMIIAIGHGENADLVASFKDGGIDVALEGYTARAIYQPKSKWGTDDWYECPCEIVENTVIAHWGNTYDNGDDAVKLFMHLVKNGKVAYPAIYQIKLFASPGFSPSAIEPIPETIDFAQYKLENAPWVETDDYDSDMANIQNSITSLDGESVKSIEYTGTNKIIVKQFLQANPNAVVIWKADGLGTMTQNIFKKTGNDGEYWTYSCFDASTNQWAWFKITTDFEITIDFILHKSDVSTIGDSTLSTTYSATPRFTDWTVNYSFEVSWDNEHSIWVFESGFGDTVSGDTAEWHNPNATHLYVYHDDTDLEANRTRLDVGYVLGSQTDKPLQPMGDYATIDDVQSVSTVKTIVPDTLGTTIYISAETNHVYGVRPYGNNIHISATFSLPTSQLFECTFDVDTRDAENEIDLILDTTTFRFLAESGGLVDIIAMNPGGLYRIHLTETTFAMESQPVIYVTREVLWEGV